MSTSRHPKGLYLIFATSTAERFSYYGMRAIFILFLTQALLFDKEHAASIYGSYTGLVYLTPLIGGYIADKYWGIRRSVFWGAMMMAVGQFLMFASASMLEARELSHWLMYGGLTFLILGNGCFKPTVSSLVGQLYEPGDKRLDSAYTIFYMGVNVGSFLAPLVCGYFGETGNPHDFRWGFLIAAIVTVLTVVLFETQKNKYLIGPDGKPLGIIPDARKERPQADNTARKSAHANGRPMRNYLLLALLAIALAGFFYWCFGRRLDKHRHLHRLHRVSRQHPAGRLTHQDGARPHLRHLHHRLLRHFLLGGLRAGRRLAHAFRLRADRPRHPGVGNARLLDSVLQPLLCGDTCRHHAGRMGRPGQTGHGARLAHQASHRPATAFTGLSRHLLWGERCSAGHQGESHLADGALLHPYHGRNLPLAHRALHGEQAHAHPLRLADDGDMVPLHRHCQ